jgi:DNA repair exonuclease SbcCD ATPase subunit
MLLECACGKMYRVRDDAANPPTKCPACGRPLKQHSAGAPSAATAGPDPKVKDLEGKVQILEKEISASKASSDLKDKELRESQASISRLGSDLEKAQAAYKEALRKKESEIEERQKKIADLEGEGTKARQASQAQAMGLLKQKDAALQEARERVSQLEEELAAAGSKGGVPAEIEARLKELEAEVETGRESRAKLVEEMGREKDAFRDSLEVKVAELEESERRAAALEKQLQEGGGGDPQTPAEERLRQRVRQLEKIVQDGERRYREILSRTEQQGGDAAASATAAVEKDGELTAARASLEAETSKREALERRVKELETAAPAAAPAPAARLGEARYLAGDLDKSLGSISTELNALVERVKRLAGALEEAESAAPPVAPPVLPDPSPEPPAMEPPAELVDEAAQEPEEPKEAVAPLEAFPEPEPVEPGGLPADETLLDLGGMKRRPPAPEEEAPAAEPPLESVPLSAETSPGPLPEEQPAESAPESELPKKKGFFGKLFGKK